ncbi:uncharacterized protein LOC144716757 [Wolffia australiana]
MASTCARSVNRASLSSLRSRIKTRIAAELPRREPSQSGFSPSVSSSPNRRPLFLTRCPPELGSALMSLFPLHSAVAAAKLTSCLSATSQESRAFAREVGVAGPR